MTREIQLLALVWLGGAAAVAHNYAGLAFFDKVLASYGVAESDRVRWKVWLSRATGIFAMGVVPLTVAVGALGLSGPQLGLTVDTSMVTLLVGASGGLPVLGCLALRYVPSLLERYPEIRVAEWPPSRVAENTASWVVYIAAYEILFRGIFLFPLVEVSSPAVAVVVSTLFYSFTHTPKHVLEGTLTLAAGLYLSWAALHTGSILGPYIFHLFLAAGTELMAIRANPNMSFANAESARAI